MIMGNSLAISRALHERCWSVAGVFIEGSKMQSYFRVQINIQVQISKEEGSEFRLWPKKKTDTYGLNLMEAYIQGI